MNTAEKLHTSDLDVPLRLDVAAEKCFPNGGMTARGLRREYARGRLVIFRVAGKDYTTRREVDRMIELCRLEDKARDSGCANPGATSAETSLTLPSGSLSTDTISKARAAASMIADKLSNPFQDISPKSTSTMRRKSNVVHLKSR